MKTKLEAQFALNRIKLALKVKGGFGNYKTSSGTTLKGHKIDLNP